MLRVTAPVRDELLAHAIAGRPNEACGMFSARNGSELSDRFHPMRNAADSREVFALDGQEMLDLEQQVDDAGRTLVGVMHSHPATSPYPSPTDVADSGRFDPTGMFHHVIVSLRQAEAEMRSFRIVDGEIIEEPIAVAGTEPVLQDGAGAIAAVARLPRPGRR